jgi:hypothetical protein
MTITIEQIKGMNLQVGEMIELEIIAPHEKTWTSLGYFQGLIKEGSLNVVEYYPDNLSQILSKEEADSRRRRQMLTALKGIRRLKYAE